MFVEDISEGTGHVPCGSNARDRGDEGTRV